MSESPRPRRPVLKRTALRTAAVVLVLAGYFGSPPFTMRIAERYFPAAIPALNVIYAPSGMCVSHEGLPGSDLYRRYLTKSDRIAREAFRERIDPMEKLRERTSLEFSGTPLRDVLSYASEIHEIPLDLDSSADGNAKVTIQPNGGTLQKALEELLEPHGLIAIPDAERILVGTPSAIRQKQATADANVVAGARLVHTVLLALFATTLFAAWMVRRKRPIDDKAG